MIFLQSEQRIVKCERDVIMTGQGPVIVCHGCKRIVIDNRNLK